MPLPHPNLRNTAQRPAATGSQRRKLLPFYPFLISDSPPCAPHLQEARIHKIRIYLTSRNVKALEKVCADLIKGAKDKRLLCKGPVRMPTKVIRRLYPAPCRTYGGTEGQILSQCEKREEIIFPLTGLLLACRLSAS